MHSSNESGFTIMELLVASFIGIAMLTLAAGATMSNRAVYHSDLSRTRLQQTLKSSLNLVGIHIREAGENLTVAFPAIELLDGTGPGGQDELIVRRNLIDERLWVCQEITAGTTNSVIFAMPGTTPGCTYSDNTFTYGVWRQKRLAAGGTIHAYIYDIASKEGEFFIFNNDEDDGSSLSITRTGSWANDYQVGAASVYLLEEWRFRIDALPTGENVLQLIENSEFDAPKNIAYDLTDFQVSIQRDDGTVMNTFTKNDNWVTISHIEIEISGEEFYREQLFSDSVSTRFFPRNILSN